MIVAVVGLEREARIVTGPEIVVSRRGSDLRALIAKGTDGIISIGIAAGLDPSLEIGACVIASRITTGHEDFPTNPAWTREIALFLPGARSGVILGIDMAVASAEEKALLRGQTSALAADMESHIAARAAAHANLPLVALRIISDTAQDALPPAAIAAMREDGSIDVRAVIASLIAKPAQIPALMRTARNAEIAFKALLRCRSALGPRFAFPDLG